MKLQRVEFQELKGIDKASVEGVTQDAPTSLVGWEFTRSGGFTSGPAVETVSASVSGVDATLVGFDNRGMFGTVEYASSSHTLYLVRQDASNSSVSLSDSTSVYTFIPKAGLHHIPALVRGGQDISGNQINTLTTSGRYLLARANGNILQPDTSATVSTSFHFNSFSVSSDGTFSSGTLVQVAAFRYVRTEAGSVITDYTTKAIPVETSNDRSVVVGFEEGRTISGSRFDVYARWGTPATSFPYVGYYQEDLSGEWTYLTTRAGAYGDLTIRGDEVSSRILPRGWIPNTFKDLGELHNRRFYAVVNNDVADQGFIAGQNTHRALSNTSIVYSEQAYVNLTSATNFFAVPFTVSNEVTALTSTPAGLLIFGDRETFLMRSDPALPDFQVQRVSGVVGHDSDDPPAVIGGMVFTVFDGGVYAVNFGMGDVDFGRNLTKISQPFEGVDTFTSVWPNIKKRYVLAQAGDTFYRYYVDHNKWAETDFSDASNSVIVPTVLDSGVRRVSAAVHVNERAAGSAGGGSTVKWEHVDLGDKNVEKLWRRAYVQMNDSFSGSITMTFVPSTGAGGSLGVVELPGKRFVGTFPAGVVEEKLREFQVTVSGSVVGDTMEPPVTFEFVPRYRQRG